MATPQGDGSIILNTKVDTSGIKKGMSSIATGAKGMAITVGKAFLAIGAAASAATIAMAKASVDAFAEYEQLVGGVETLFKGSSKKLIEYANQAYKTAGLSANKYMSTVTSFSASLISSLGGDTEKAADIANQALIDMSDNANKMGTSMEAIQNAYQGFAKQNYTMLDNLKLGFGGTKTEMERLLKDAQAITGVEYDISNLADVYTAIHVIQENLGIAGTTALEAEKTISGSAATMKAAWQNVLAAISGGGDLDRATNNLVDSISNYIENIVPVVEKALSGIGRLIERVAPMLVQTLARAIIKAIPSLLNAVLEMVVGAARGLYQGVLDLFKGTTREVLTEQADVIEQSVENQNELTEAVKETAKEAKKTLAGFDDIQILTSAAADDAFEQPIMSGALDQVMSENLIEEEDTAQVQKFGVAMEYLAELGKKVGDAFSSIKEPLSRLWEEGLSPILQGVWNIATYLVSTIADIFDTAGEGLGEFAPIIDAITVVLEVAWAVIEPVALALVDIVYGTLKPMLKIVLNIIGAIGESFSFWKNIISAVVELFKGNTDEALEYAQLALANFVNFWVNIANAIINVINTLWTAIFSAFKGIVNGVGGIIEKIGSWLGKDWELAWNASAPLIPEIPKYVPKLAQGAVIPPNREFLAVLGDQKRGTNIEAPLSTIEEAVENVLNRRGYGANATAKEEHYYLDETQLMSIVYKLFKGGERLNGASLVDGGV